MTYDQLVAFLAVAGEGGFINAAAKLHKSQPAVSKLVRNLEEELGLELFDRGKYRATLTDEGRLVHERATAVIEGTESLRSFAMQLAGKVEPIVRIGVDAVAPLGPIAAILRAARERHPSVRFELFTERLAGAAQALGEGRADLVVATLLGMDAARTEVARFGAVRIVPVARRDHPLATCGVPIPRALLRAHAQIVLRDSAQAADSPSLNVLAGGLRWSVTDIAAKKELILAGMGWGGLPEHVVADALASGELAALRVPEFAAEAMELFVARRRDVAHGVVAGELWQELGRLGDAAPRRRGRRAPGSRDDRRAPRGRDDRGTPGRYRRRR